MGLIAISVGVGAFLYHEAFSREFDKGTWISAIHRAAMIISGMGPTGAEPASDGERLFVILYAFFASFVLVAIVGMILSSIFHRVLHQFHVASDEDDLTVAGPHGAKPAIRRSARRKPSRTTIPS